MPKPESNLPVPEFVSQIVKDPNKHVEVLLLSGFVGPSSEKEHTRLYFDPELSQYVEIPNKAILHSQQMGPETSPLGGVYLWIARDAQLVQGKAGTERAKAKFFEGPIAQGAAGGGAPALPITVPAPICTGIGPHCGGTQGPPCPTHVATACPPCPTHVATGCPPCPTHVATPCPPCTPTVPATHCCLTQPVTHCGPCTHVQTPCIVCTPVTHCGPCTLADCPTQPVLCHPTVVNCPVQTAICGAGEEAGFPGGPLTVPPAICTGIAPACPTLHCTPTCPTQINCTPLCPTHVAWYSCVPDSALYSRMSDPRELHTPVSHKCGLHARVPNSRELHASVSDSRKLHTVCPTHVACTLARPTHVNCTPLCPTIAGCQTQAVACHPTLAGCPSVVDACPTSLGCTIACNTIGCGVTAACGVTAGCGPGQGFGGFPQWG